MSKDKKGAAAVAEPTTEALAVKQPQGIAAQTFAAMEGFSADDVRGKEGITSADLRLPFLSLAQKTSGALDATEDSYIDGLTFGDFYNSETSQIYGKEPLRIIPLFHRKRAYLPDEKGRMGDPIAWDDARCGWPTKEQAEKRKAAGDKHFDKPEGMQVYDWVVLLMIPDDGPTLAIVSFKSKSFKAGQQLVTFVSMVKGPTFSAQYLLGTALETNEAGKFAKFTVKPAGKPSPEEAQYAGEVYESVKDKNLVTENDPAEPGSSDGPAQPAKSKEDGPF